MPRVLKVLIAVLFVSGVGALLLLQPLAFLWYLGLASPFLFSLVVLLVTTILAFRTLKLANLPGCLRLPFRLAAAIFASNVVSIAFRVMHTRTWRPKDHFSVLSFASNELCLVPLGLLLLGVSLMWLMGRKRESIRGFLDKVEARAGGFLPALIVIIAITATIFTCRYGYIRLSRDWEWGCYGLGPPVRLVSILQITQAGELTLPEQARLIDGEFLGGFNPYLIAKVQIPKQDVEGFLDRHHAQVYRDTIDPSHDVTHWFYNRMQRLMSRKGWHLNLVQDKMWAFLHAPWYDRVFVMLDLDGQENAFIYLYWQTIDQSTPWCKERSLNRDR